MSGEDALPVEYQSLLECGKRRQDDKEDFDSVYWACMRNEKLAKWQQEEDWINNS